MKKIDLVQMKAVLLDVYGLDDINQSTALNFEKTLSEDNDNFFNKLREEYSVDFSGFDYYEFFYEDQFILLNWFRDALKVLGINKSKKKKELTIQHLIEVVNTGKWFPPS